MARIIENANSRRMIKLSACDIISIVREYQNIVSRGSSYADTIDTLENNVIYIPEEY